LHCSNLAISSKRGTALHHKKMGRTKKLTPDISQFIETLPYLDASLTNFEINLMVNREYAPVQLSELSLSAERRKLGFTWQPPLHQ
jgi:hypothetical protein